LAASNGITGRVGATTSSGGCQRAAGVAVRADDDALAYGARSAGASSSGASSSGAPLAGSEPPLSQPHSTRTASAIHGSLMSAAYA
jgi:hypothetical protein